SGGAAGRLQRRRSDGALHLHPALDTHSRLRCGPVGGQSRRFRTILRRSHAPRQPVVHREPGAVSEELKECLSGAIHNAGFCAAALGPLAIAIFDRAATEEDAQAMARVLATIAPAHPSIAILSVVGRDCTVPDAKVRHRLTSEVKNIQKQLVAAATVIEGSGFRAAAI